MYNMTHDHMVRNVGKLIMIHLISITFHIVRLIIVIKMTYGDI